MKGCTIYKISKKLLLVCMHETDAKFYNLGEPVKTLESGANPIEVGNAVLEIIGCSQQGLPVHSAGFKIVPVILRAAGVKSWRKFEADVTECFAQFDGTTVQVTPCLKTGESSRPHLPDERVVCPPMPKELGETVIRLLAELERISPQN